MKKNITLGIIIIVIGVIWLLSNLATFPFSVIDVFFRSLGTLWPLILIGIGLNILIKDKLVLRVIIWVFILLIILFYGLYGQNIWKPDFSKDSGNNSANLHSIYLSDTATIESKFSLLT